MHGNQELYYPMPTFYAAAMHVAAVQFRGVQCSAVQCSAVQCCAVPARMQRNAVAHKAEKQKA